MLVMTIRSRLVSGRRNVTDRQILDRTEFRVPIGESLESATAEMAFDMARKIALSLETDF